MWRSPFRRARPLPPFIDFEEVVLVAVPVPSPLIDFALGPLPLPPPFIDFVLVPAVFGPLPLLLLLPLTPLIELPLVEVVVSGWSTNVGWGTGCATGIGFGTG